VIGVVYFGEAMNWLKAASLGLIVIGLVGLNLAARSA